MCNSNSWTIHALNFHLHTLPKLFGFYGTVFSLIFHILRLMFGLFSLHFILFFFIILGPCCLALCVFFFIEVGLIYYIILVLGVQHSDSTIYMHY